MRIHGIDFKEGDGGDAMEIEKCCNVMDIPFNKIEIDRGHGTGKPFLDKERQKKVLVKF